MYSGYRVEAYLRGMLFIFASTMRIIPSGICLLLYQMESSREIIYHYIYISSQLYVKIFELNSHRAYSATNDNRV